MTPRDKPPTHTLLERGLRERPQNAGFGARGAGRKRQPRPGQIQHWNPHPRFEGRMACPHLSPPLTARSGCPWEALQPQGWRQGDDPRPPRSGPKAAVPLAGTPGLLGEQKSACCQLVLPPGPCLRLQGQSAAGLTLPTLPTAAMFRLGACWGRGGAARKCRRELLFGEKGLKGAQVIGQGIQRCR